ncbi:lysyl-tRNA synthetase [Enterococcus faecalis]|nr:lysyl-tRNA synthetase [Enterococcus faecalis]
MGRGIADRVKRAYYPTIILLIGAILYSFVVDFSMFSIFYLAILLFIVIFSKSELYREQLVYSWEWMTIDGFIFGLLTLLYLVIGVYNFTELPTPSSSFCGIFLVPFRTDLVVRIIAILLVMSF